MRPVHGKPSLSQSGGKPPHSKRSAHSMAPAYGATAFDRVGCRGLRLGTLPHHRTCGFPHPAIERSGLYTWAARSDGMRNPCARRRVFLKAVCSEGLAAIGQAPRELWATLSSRPCSSSWRKALNRPLTLCQRSQKHLRMCRRIQPSSPKMLRRSSASW